MTSLSQLKLAIATISKSGEITPKSIENLTEDEIELVQTLFNQGLLAESLNYMEDLNSDTDWNKLKQKLVKSKKKTIPLWKSVMRYAAVFIGVIAVAFLVEYKENSATDHQASQDNLIKLSLGNDDIRFVVQGESEEIIDPSGKVIAKQQGGTIKYLKNSEITELVFHELYIPFGKIFNLELSDGTIVHLNSGTKIKYPVQFQKGQKREVFVEGEAYFEVAKDKEDSFIVNADAVSIEVLGTKFGVSTYKENSEIETVLVEGSISMSNSFDTEDAVILTPGTKGAFHKTEHLTTVENVDVRYYTGWMQGELIFKNSSFENMIKKLERKYNVQIKNNNGPLANKLFNASFSKKVESIEDVLKYINEIHAFNYDISDNHIIIY
jgi:transmembrane sensor